MRPPKKYALPKKNKVVFARLSSWFGHRKRDFNDLYGNDATRLWVRGIVTKIDEDAEKVLVSFPARLEAHWKKGSYFLEDFVRNSLSTNMIEYSIKLFLEKEGSNYLKPEYKTG
jgi:hypothetical protein